MTRSRSLPHGLVRRAMVLLAADGWMKRSRAPSGCRALRSASGAQRFLEGGLPGLHDELRPGAPRADEQVAEVVQDEPKDTRCAPNPPRMAHMAATPPTEAPPPIPSSWTKYDIIPRSTPWSVVDEKRIQALGTNSADAALGLGIRGRRYARLADILFAALAWPPADPASSPGIPPGHIDDISISTLSRYATHKHEVKRWLARRPRSRVTLRGSWRSGSGHAQAIRRGSFRKVKELVERIERYTDKWNAKARPFVWTATADSILVIG